MLNLDFSKPETFRHSLHDLGFITSRCRIDRKRAAAFFGISESTLERWIYTGKPSPTAIRLIENFLFGIDQSGSFKGFSIDRDQNLVTPDGYQFSARYIEGIWILQQNVGFYESYVHRLKDEISRLKGLANSREKIVNLANQIIEETNSLSCQPAGQVLRLVSESQAKPERSEQSTTA